MRLTRRTLLILISSLILSSLVLLLDAFAGERQHETLLLLSGIGLIFSALAVLLWYTFASRRAAENNRQELEQRLSFVVQHIKDYAIFLIDPEGRVMSWNKGAQDIKGYTESEIIGKPISVFYTEEDNQSGEPFLNLQRALEDGRYESMGLRKRKDGSVFYADVIFTPIRDDKNVLKGFVKITRDITDQKKAEEDVLSALRREKELNEMKSRFVTLASHEFKTPLSVILSSVSLIEKYQEPGMEDKRLKHIHRIKSNVNNLKQILNDFLSLEKLEGGIVKNFPVAADLIHITRETMQDMEEARKEGQDLHLHINGEPRSIWIDTQLLRNVLNNLLSNAIKYSPAHTSVECTIFYYQASADIQFKDQGIGIPAEDQEHLFERFFRASNTMGISGTGLGLSIVKRYLDLMGGTIRVKSAPGEGTVFTVTLPANVNGAI